VGSPPPSPRTVLSPHCVPRTSPAPQISPDRKGRWWEELSRGAELGVQRVILASKSGVGGGLGRATQHPSTSASRPGMTRESVVVPGWFQMIRSTST
jgi:hypothetical protein